MANLDRISQLPEPLILDILSRLPLEDYARASILSKTLKSYYSFFPILYFDHNLFATQCLVSAKEGGRDLDLNQIRDMFMNNVDCQLSRARQLDTPIRKLALTVAINDIMYFSRIDTWLDLVGQINVEDLCLVVHTVDYMWEDFIHQFSVLYEFPISVLASKRLRSVDIRGCKLCCETFVSDPMNKRGTSFSSLQRLFLSHVFMDEPVLEGLIRFCPGIETLILDRCYVDVEFLWLSKFPRLKKAVIELQGGEIDTIDLVDTNIQCFKCDVNTNYHVSPAVCAGIRELDLSRGNINLPNLFKDLTATFPLLEEVYVFIQHTDTLKAASNVLRKLRFRSYGSVFVKEVRIDCPNLTLFDCMTTGLSEIDVDCPKLRVFSYYGNTVPKRFSFSSMADLEESCCTISIDEAFDTMCLVNLREFLVLTRGRATNVSLSVKLPMVTFEPEEVEAIEASPQYNVHLVLYFPSDDFTNVCALVDGLLWTIRPTTLALPCSTYYAVKYLCDNLDLLMKSRNNNCDVQVTPPCWMHHLEDFEVKYLVESTQDIFSYENLIMKSEPKVFDEKDSPSRPTEELHAEYPFDISNIKENLTYLPDHCRSVQSLIRFKFQWSYK